MDVLFSSKRLIFRKLEESDLANIAGLLEDAEVMRFCSGAMDEKGASRWLDACIKAYVDPGYDYWGVELKDCGGFIGQMGILREDVGGILLDCLAFMLCRRHWGRGYALEGAKACLGYAFRDLGMQKVYATLEEGNEKSRAVLDAIGMEMVKKDSFRGKPVLLYCLRRQKWSEGQCVG